MSMQDIKSAEFKVTSLYTTVTLVQVGTEDKERKYRKVIVFSIEGNELPDIGDIFTLVPKKIQKKKKE